MDGLKAYWPSSVDLGFGLSGSKSCEAQTQDFLQEQTYRDISLPISSHACVE